MKIQDLAIIFIIIILPISLVVETYTKYQIQTINTQTLYDTKLSAATYDAIRAFQINTTTSKTSDLANSKLRDLEASVSTFRNSIMSTFELDGYSKDDLDRYIPALVYTLYDGFYIYSPYHNVNYQYEPQTDENGIIKDEDGNIQYTTNPKDGNGSDQYGLKPYISYSCRYKTGNIDVVITYALDNHISVQGMINGEYVDKEGYLIDNIQVDGDIHYNGVNVESDTINHEGTVKYNGVEIENEHTKQYIPISGGIETFSYVKIGGVTYYLDDSKPEGERTIIARLNENTLTIQYREKNNEENFRKIMDFIQNNSLAKDYYIDAYKFTKWFKGSGLQALKYKDALDSIVDDEGNIKPGEQVFQINADKNIFDFNSAIEGNYQDNIENELSNFNEHRLSVIRHKIEVNLAIAIANYNNYSGVATTNVFQMPKLKEGDWYNITHNISLISFLQGLPIGGKIYNGYGLVTNSESEEVVLEPNIYILGERDGKKEYYRIGDQGIRDGSVTIDSGEYAASSTPATSAGRLNLDFERDMLTNTDASKSFYYYPLQSNNASYNSIVMQNNVDTYDDIYAYVNNSPSYDLKVAFYTALGRERASRYSSWRNYISENINFNPDIDNPGTPVDPVEPEIPESPVEYNIFYKVDGVIIQKITVKKDEEHTILPLPPSTSDKTYTCWSGAGGVITYAPGDKITVGSSDITLTALYDIIVKHKVEYENINNSNNLPKEVVHGKTFTVDLGPLGGDAIEVKENKIVLNSGSRYTLNGSVLTITNVNGDINIRKYTPIKPYTITNMVKNGSFESGLTNWRIPASGGQATTTCQWSRTGSLAMVRYGSTQARNHLEQVMNVQSGHIYYLFLYGISDTGQTIISNVANDNNDAIIILYSNAQKYTKGSARFTSPGTGQNGLEINWGPTTGSSYVDDIGMIDLTAAFGAGNEPSKAWCDANIDWFNGSKTIYK